MTDAIKAVNLVPKKSHPKSNFSMELLKNIFDPERARQEVALLSMDQLVGMIAELDDGFSGRLLGIIAEMHAPDEIAQLCIIAATSPFAPPRMSTSRKAVILLRTLGEEDCLHRFVYEQKLWESEWRFRNMLAGYYYDSPPMAVLLFFDCLLLLDSITLRDRISIALALTTWQGAILRYIREIVATVLTQRGNKLLGDEEHEKLQRLKLWVDAPDSSLGIPP